MPRPKILLIDGSADDLERLRGAIGMDYEVLQADQDGLEGQFAARSAELERSEAKLRTMFELLPMGISITDPDGRLVDCNQAAETLLGIPRAEHLRRSFDGPQWRLLRPDGSEMPVEEYASVRALREGRVVRDVEMGVERPEGVTWLSVSAMPAAHPAYGVVIAFIDITERKRLAQDLDTRMRELRAILDNSSVAIAFVRDRRQVWVNQRMCELFGYSLDEMVGMPTEHFYHNREDYERIGREGYPALMRGERFFTETLMRRRDGSRLWIKVQGKLIDPAKPEAGSIWILQDISDYKAVQAELTAAKEAAEAATKAKSAFLAHMSHEIRTPMNGIIGLSELALQQTVNPITRRYLEQLHHSGINLLGILNDILDQSKIDAGQLSLEETPFDRDRLLESERSLFAPIATGKGLELAIEADPKVPRWLVGDELRLRQVLSNLLSNAIKFTETGRITLQIACIECTEAVTRLRWTVTDTGIGMDRETRARLFQPFTQGDDSIARRFGGTGLGLSISRRLIEMMGGQLEVESALEGGSRFSFEVRLKIAEAPSAAAQTDVSARVDLSGVRVLVAEDQPINQQVIRGMLALLGTEAIIVGDGQQALEQLAASAPPDLVLMDIQMPRMDGLTATRQLRANPAWRELPVIALTAGVTAAEREKITTAGMSDLLPKPVTLDTLNATIARWLAPATIQPEPASRTVEADAAEGTPVRPAADGSTSTPTLHLASAPEDKPSTLVGFDLSTLNEIYDKQEDINNLLRGFADSVRDNVDNIAGAIAREDWTTAYRGTHQLKGVAANVGATRLSAAAEALDNILGEVLEAGSSPDSITQLAPLIERLRGAHADALAQIAALGTLERSVQPLADPGEASRQLHELRALLRQSRFVSPAMLERLRTSLPESSRASLEAMKACLRVFDYPSAELCLQALIDQQAPDQTP
ncbi:ATP-binding protein [Thiorhodovibrio frisius]|nr:ATP-binding protein [Thiorhodovibrio frisius]